MESKLQIIRQLTEVALKQPEHAEKALSQIATISSPNYKPNDAQADCLRAHAGEAGACIDGVFYAAPANP